MNNTNPLVSIIVPTYNHGQFVSLCLDSILHDDYPNKELIIIDDGSIDDTVQKVEEWVSGNKNKIKVLFIKKQNAGVSKALNDGLDLANGLYVLPIASDDLICNNSIRSRVDFLEKNEQYGAVFGDCTVIDEKGLNIFQSGIFCLHGALKENYLSSSQKLAREIIWRWSVPGPVLLYRKDYIFSIGKYNEKFKVEDWDIYLRMAASRRLAYLDKVVSSYRIHGRNASRNNPHRVRQIHYDLLKIAFANCCNFQGALRYLLIKKAAVICYLLALSYFGKKI